MGKKNKKPISNKTKKPPMIKKRKFKESWRTHPKLKDWLEYNYHDSKAFCKFCHSTIGFRLSNLLMHAERIVHKKACNSVKAKTNLRKSRCSSSQASLNFVQYLDLSKCLNVILLANKHKMEKLVSITELNSEVIEEILQCKEHIQKIVEYVPNAIKFITPNELNEIIAITEILKEFMWRLMRQNFQITDEELRLNADLLTRIFCVTAIQIDDNWRFFFRNNFLKSICSDKPTIAKYDQNSFCVRNIFNYVQHMIDPEVVARFNEHLQKNSNDLILICNDMFGKQTHQLKENQETMTDTIKEEEGEPQELCIKEEIEIGEYTINMNTINANEMLNEPCEGNTAEEYISDDDSIEFYEVIDEADHENLMKVVEKTEATTDETQKNMYVECNIKQENENQEYTATKYLPDLFNYSQELLVDQIKADPIEINSDDNIEKGVFVKSEAMQSPIQAIYVEPLESSIKQESCETNASSGRNENYRDHAICVDSYTIEFPKSYLCAESLKTEIKQEPNETNASSIYQEMSEEPQIAKQLPMEIHNAEVDNTVETKEHEIEDKPNEIHINYDSMHTDVAKKYKCGDHLKEHRAFQIGKILNLKPYGKLSCEILLLDPIICTYMHILSIKTPLYNEVALRMSFKIVLGEELYDCQYQYSLQSDDLELYRHLIILAYSTKYKCFQLKDIVNDTDLKMIVNNAIQILEKWRNFFNKHFISTLYRKAVYEMLFEYNTRYILKSKVLDREATTEDIKIKYLNLKVLLPAKPPKLFRTTIKKIEQLLRSDFELELKNWERGYMRYVKKKISKAPYETYRLYKTNSLSLNQIYEDIKGRLPLLVVANLCCVGEKHNMQLVKSNDSESSKAIDPPLNKDTEDAFVTQETNIMIKKGQNDKVYSKRFSSRDLPIKKSENINKTPIEKQAHTLETEQISNVYRSKEPQKKKQKVEDLIHIVDNNSNFKDIENINDEASEKSLTEIDLRVEEINTHASDVNTVETIEIAIIKKFQIWQASHLMCVLQNDPIITSYLRLFKTLYNEIDLPVYSETILRKAFDETFADNNIGQYSECQQQDLQLYSKLLLLYYTHHDKFSKTRIADIMICFDETSMTEHLENIPSIIIEWRTFFEKNLSRLLYKQAIYAMLYEYIQRYLRIQNEIYDETLILTAAKIQRFLHCYIILPDQWLQHFKSLYKIRLQPNNYITNLDLFRSLRPNQNNNSSKLLFGYYLDFLTIYGVVKHRVNFLITDTLISEMGLLHPFYSAGKFVEFVNIKEQLGQDPIIKKYFELSNFFKNPAGLPVFNVKLLRSSFNEVFRDYKKPASIISQYSQLYCQLILFKYSEQYSVAELDKIMICFPESSIRRYFRNYLFILRKWKKFNMDFLTVNFQQAPYELLYEHARRFIQIYGHVTHNHLKKKSEEIKDFFGQTFNLPTNWLSDYHSILLKRLATAKKDVFTNLSYEDLVLANIYKSIKSRFHYSDTQARDLIVTSCKIKESSESEEEVMEIIRPIKQYVRKNFMEVNDKSDAQTHSAKIARDSCENIKVHNEGTQESSANSFIIVEEIDHDKEETLYELSLVDGSLTKELEIECKQALKQEIKSGLESKNAQQDTRNAKNDAQTYSAKIAQDSCENTKVHNQGKQESSANSFIIVEEIDHDQEETLYELSLVDGSLTKELEIDCKQALKRNIKSKLETKNSQQYTRIRSEKLKQLKQYKGEKSDDFVAKHQESEATTIETTKLNENKIVFNGLRKKIKASTSKQCDNINKSEEVICRITDYESNDEEEIEIIVMSDSE